MVIQENALLVQKPGSFGLGLDIYLEEAGDKRGT
jgi:hypothetical protein